MSQPTRPTPSKSLHSRFSVYRGRRFKRRGPGDAPDPWPRRR